MIKQPLSVSQWGQFFDPIPPSSEFLTLNFSLNSENRLQRWRNYGLSADFLGDYFANFFPGNNHAPNSISQQDAIKGSVSYIANELLENAVKYAAIADNSPITITLRLYDQQIIFETRNITDIDNAEKYQRFIERLLKSDPNELYIEQLEKSALGNSGESHIGLLTMINDYQAQFGWQFAPVADSMTFVWVTVLTHLDINL
ncbi:MAG: DUF6272 family protein [Synechocystis sp.]|nr:DUF6272 family protein [Synechocystis sp.]